MSFALFSCFCTSWCCAAVCPAAGVFIPVVHEAVCLSSGFSKLPTAPRWGKEGPRKWCFFSGLAIRTAWNQDVLYTAAQGYLNRHLYAFKVFVLVNHSSSTLPILQMKRALLPFPGRTNKAEIRCEVFFFPRSPQSSLRCQKASFFPPLCELNK